MSESTFSVVFKQIRGALQVKKNPSPEWIEPDLHLQICTKRAMLPKLLAKLLSEAAAIGPTSSREPLLKHTAPGTAPEAASAHICTCPSPSINMLGENGESIMARALPIAPGSLLQ